MFLTFYKNFIITKATIFGFKNSYSWKSIWKGSRGKNNNVWSYWRDLNVDFGFNKRGWWPQL